MRAKSSNNFTLKDLVEIVKHCQLNNIKTYITLNTIIYDHDLLDDGGGAEEINRKGAKI